MTGEAQLGNAEGGVAWTEAPPHAPPPLSPWCTQIAASPSPVW